MPTHYTNDLIFDLPDPLIDITQHVFSLSEDNSSSLFSLVINNYKIDQDETLQSYETNLIAELEKTFPHFLIQANGEMKVADQDAVWHIYTFIHEGQRLYQANVVFFDNGNGGPGTRKAIQVTANSVGSFTDEWKRSFDAILASIRFRRAPTAQVNS